MEISVHPYLLSGKDNGMLEPSNDVIFSLDPKCKKEVRKGQIRHTNNQNIAATMIFYINPLLYLLSLKTRTRE